jgi:Leucine-rich repeat (LRR) protein
VVRIYQTTGFRILRTHASSLWALFPMNNYRQGFQFDTEELNGVIPHIDGSKTLFEQLGKPPGKAEEPEQLTWIVSSPADLDNVHVASTTNATYARYRGATVLRADSLALTVLPNLSLYRLLQRVDLSMNALCTLPASFGELVNCETLNLTSNSLKEFPSAILGLRALKSLNVSGNSGIKTLPRGISALQHLEMLFAPACGLVSIPSTIGCLTRLNQLQLHDNRFVRLPSSIYSMNSLQALYLQSNRLKTLPVEIGSLTSLKMLFLQDNALKSLPYSMQQLKNLWFLDISNNQIDALPSCMKRSTHINTFVSKNNGCGPSLATAKFALAQVTVRERKRVAFE